MLGGYYLGQLYPGISGLPVAGILVIQDAIHSVTAESPTLTQKHQLLIDDSTLSLLADSPELATSLLLLINDAIHSLTSDAVIIKLHKNPEGPFGFVAKDVPFADVAELQQYINVEKDLTLGSVKLDTPSIDIELVQPFAQAALDRMDADIEVVALHGGIFQEKPVLRAPDGPQGERARPISTTLMEDTVALMEDPGVLFGSIIEVGERPRMSVTVVDDSPRVYSASDRPQGVSYVSS